MTLRITQLSDTQWIVEMPAIGGWINMTTDVYGTLEDAQRALQEAEDTADYSMDPEDETQDD